MSISNLPSSPRRQNGKRSFEIVPATVIAWTQGYAPITETEALVALGWILRRLSRWKTNANVFDLMRDHSGRGATLFPELSLEGDNVFQRLRGLLARLAVPAENAEFVRFARKMLGFTCLESPILIPARKPAANVFTWLRNLYGCALQKSPNNYHSGAVWLHGATLRLNAKGTLWQLRVSYGFRHEDGWAISLDQLPGEKLEAFDARAWLWLTDQIAWRHDEKFYRGFLVSAEAMKLNELRTGAQTENKMVEMRRDLRNVFAQGGNSPGYWERDLAESLVHDAHPQYRELKKVAMSKARLETLARWIREDRLADAQKNAAA